MELIYALLGLIGTIVSLAISSIIVSWLIKYFFIDMHMMYVVRDANGYLLAAKAPLGFMHYYTWNETWSENKEYSYVFKTTEEVILQRDNLKTKSHFTRI